MKVLAEWDGPMSFRYEIRLSGSGGQGFILMGIILAEAIGIYDGKYVAQTQSYGPEARGGFKQIGGHRER